MPKPKKGPRLGSHPHHQRLMLSNLAVSLFQHERITTTEAKAKMLRPYAERLITKAKKGDVHNRRQVLAVIEDRNIVHKLFSEIAPRFADRNGGYTRILKMEPRTGDGAPMALIELLDADLSARHEPDADTKTRRRRTRRGPASDDPEADSVLADDDLIEDDADEADDADEIIAGAEPDAEDLAEDADEPEEDDASEPDAEDADEPEAEPAKEDE